MTQEGRLMPWGAAALSRRAWLQNAGLVLWLMQTQSAWGARIVAVRVWPAAEYTRVTIESDVPLKTEQTLVDKPPRLAVDIQGLDLNATLRELVSQVQPNDPFIEGVRVGQFNSSTVRLVFDLKQSVKPQVFALEPVLTGQARFAHRLVLDLYPVHDADPLAALIASLGPGKQAQPSETPPALSQDALSEWVAQQTKARAARPTTPDKTPTEAQQRFVVVALDPGHGGEDPGAIGPKGTKEKDVVLQVAQQLKKRLEETPLMTRDGAVALRVFMTRDADFFVPLHERVRKARRVKADLLVSIHADAFFNAKARGASVFALSRGAATSATARWMAEQENRSDAVGGINVQTRDQTVKQALLDMSTTAQINDSLELGSHMLKHIRRVGILHKPQVEQAGFAVLKAPDIPSVLVETAFISNPEEEQLLRSPEYQSELVEALLAGILQYFKQNPPRLKQRSI